MLCTKRFLLFEYWLKRTKFFFSGPSEFVSQSLASQGLCLKNLAAAQKNWRKTPKQSFHVKEKFLLIQLHWSWFLSKEVSWTKEPSKGMQLFTKPNETWKTKTAQASKEFGLKFKSYTCEPIFFVNPLNSARYKK